MKSILQRAMLLLCFLTFSLTAFGGEVLTLEDVRNQVLSNNLDIQIQYEKYQQAQRGVGVAFGNFLPGASIHLINVNTVLAVAQSVVPTPSDWFDYQESQQLAQAEKYTSEAIKLNILEGLTNNYINIKHHEATLASMALEEELLLKEWEDAKFRETVGQATASDAFAARRFLLQHRQQMFLLNVLIAQEKEFLMIGLNRRPTADFSLAPLPELVGSTIPENVMQAIQIGLTRSPEIMSNRFQVQAAHLSTRAARWSFISFNGIGFDYPALVAIESSKARSIVLQGEKLALEIENQIATSYEKLAILNERIELQNEVIETTKVLLADQKELFEGGQLSNAVYVQAQRGLLAEERGLVTLEMEKRIQLNNIERLVGAESTVTNLDASSYEVLDVVLSTTAARFGKTNVSLTLEGPADLLKDVVSVEYSIERVVTDRQVRNSASNFRYYIRLGAARGEYNVVARIHLNNGHTLTKTDVLTLK